MDRRQFMAAAAAGFGTQLVSSSRDALAQTVTRASPSATPPLPPDRGLFESFEAKWVRTTIWREAASEVTGGALDTGHYLAEEAPQEVIDAFERFFV